MHLSPAATEDAIRLLDGREAGGQDVENFGDILDTREAADGNFLRGKKLNKRATGIEPV